MQFTLSNPFVVRVNARTFQDRRGNMSPSFVGLTHRVERRQYVLHFQAWSHLFRRKTEEFLREGVPL